MKTVCLDTNNVVSSVLTYEFTEDEIKKLLPENITAISAPDYVFVGCEYKNDEWIIPTESGYAFDKVTGQYYAHSTYREILHERTSNDTLQALRKIREDDITIDWKAWLSVLDSYNVEIENTVNQPDYPDKVIYPDYPKKPKE